MSSPTQQESFKPSQRPLLNLFALIIGIDDYESRYIPHLRFAVSDACSVRDHFRDYLKVPEDQIHLLLDKSASRKKIIEGFGRLGDDKRIQRGDPILIYFAGHGSELTPPQEWESGKPGGKVQMLVPQDYCSTQQSEINGIPDRTISALLEKIADVKGDNITVIFDCCHAASGTRGFNISDSRVRSVYLESPLGDDLDRHIWGTQPRVTLPPPRTIRGALTTHMLLAASSASQEAKEANGSGKFTAALLRLFRTVSLDELRYCDILTRMDLIQGQNPQCEGVHQRRFLFKMDDSAPYPSYSVSFKPGNNTEGWFTILAGTAHGVSVGAEFTVYRKVDISFENPLGYLVVEAVTAFTATTKHSPDTSDFMPSPNDALVVQTKVGIRDPLPIYIDPSNKIDDGSAPDPYSTLVHLMQDTRHDLQNVILVDTADQALLDFAPGLMNNDIILRIRDKNILQHGFDSQSAIIRSPIDQLAQVFKRASRYYWELRRTNYAPDITNSIHIEFYQLEATKSSFPDIELPDLFPTGKNLCQNNAVELVAEAGLFYGIKLTNKGSWDLYPSVFYFDNSDLSIVTYYEPPSSGPYVLDVPLKKHNGTLAVGYGSGGYSPFLYSLQQGQDINVGFLKLFIFTRPIADLTVPDLYPFKNTWGTIVIPIIHRRYPHIKAANLDLVPKLSHPRRSSSTAIRDRQKASNIPHNMSLRGTRLYLSIL